MNVRIRNRQVIFPLLRRHEPVRLFRIGPVTMILDFIPFVGTMGSSVLRFALGVVAFVIIAITSILVQFWYIWLLLIVGAVGYGYYKKKNAAATPAA